MMKLFALLLLGTLAGLASAAAEPREFVVHESPRPLPDIRFQDAGGRTIGLGDFRGKVVVLNVWATWCGPCRREMPTLDRLQTELGGADFQVIALSIDRKGLDVVRKFYSEIGIRHLAMHIDSSGRTARQLGALGLPTTLLIDRAGREIGRLVGPAEWDAPDMVDFIRRRLGRQSRTHLPPATGDSLTSGPEREAAASRQTAVDQPEEKPWH